MRTISTFLLEVDTPLIEKLKLANGVELYFEGRYGDRFSHNVTTEARVAYVPLGVKDIAVGEEVAISYRIVSKRIFPNNSTQFYPSVVSQDNNYGEWVTATGFQLRILAFKTTTNAKQWTGVLTRNGQWIDGCQGDEPTIERWKAQFPFGNKSKFTYQNLVDIDGQVFWKAGRGDIFAKKVEGKIISVSDRIICKPIEVDITQRYNIINGVHLPDKTLLQAWGDRGVVVSTPAHTTAIREGEVIGFRPDLAEKYTLWGQEYYLVNKKYVHSILNF